MMFTSKLLVMLTMKSPRLFSGSIFGGMTVTPGTGSRRSLPMDKGSAVTVNAILVMPSSWGVGLGVVSGQHTGGGRGLAKKLLQKTAGMGYCLGVAGIPAAGFDSPNHMADAPPLSLFGGFFASSAQHCSPWAVVCGRGEPRPGAYGRSVNPHIAALFAFYSAWGGTNHTIGAMP